MTSHAREDWIDRAREARIDDVIEQRGIVLRRAGAERVGPCPRCGGTDRFSINVKKGVFHCRGCQRGGDVIALVEFLDGVDFAGAVETLVGPSPDAAKETGAEKARFHSAVKPHTKTREAAEALRTLRYCDALWREAVRLPPDAIAYFERRGIALDDVPDQGGLRFHHACPFDGSILPCIVARFTDAATGAPGGIWRRPITGAKPKVVGPMRGHVIRLWPDDAVTDGLCIGEGVESALAAATKVAHHGTLLQPMWACACANNIRTFPVLPGVEHLTITVDNDAKRAGQDAARACATRWADEGREVELLIPDTVGADFNDLVLMEVAS
jgi:phage/plasmid primase-like uncharacterized protein